MLNKNKVQAELQQLKSNLKITAEKLIKIDLQRLHQVKEFISNQSLSKDLYLYNLFIPLTADSLIEIKNFKQIYEKILAYVLLLEAEGHRSKEFQELYARYRLIEKNIDKIVSVRNKEIKLFSSPQSNFLKRIFSLNLLRNSSEKLLAVYIKKEFLLVRLIIGISEKNEAELKLILEKVSVEKRKEKVVLAFSGVLWTIPFAGMALSILSVITLTWLNEFSRNYQELSRLLK